MIILWLDDAFDVSNNVSGAERLNSYYNKLQDLLKGEYGESVELCKCPDATIFIDYIKNNENNIVATILDILGYISDDQKNKGELKQDAFMRAYDICKSKQIPFVIYSGQVTRGSANNETFWSLINNSKSEGLFLDYVDKNDCEDPHHDQQIFNALKKQIDNFKWKGYEYVYILQAKNYINITPNDFEILERIVQSYKGKDIQYDLAFKGTMRVTIESILDTLFPFRPEERNNSRGLFAIFDYSQWEVNKRVGNEVICHNHDIDYIVEGCPIVEVDENQGCIKRCSDHRKCGKYDFNKPFFPLNVCPQEIKNALYFVWSALNNGLHNRRPTERDDNEIIVHFRNYFGNDKGVEKSYARALYESFFLVLRWYSIFMEKKLYLSIPNPNQR